MSSWEWEQEENMFGVVSLEHEIAQREADAITESDNAEPYNGIGTDQVRLFRDGQEWHALCHWHAWDGGYTWADSQATNLFACKKCEDEFPF